MTINRKFAVLALTGLLAGTAPAVAYAAGSGSSHHGTVHVWVSPTKSAAVNKILLTGVIGDYGTATSIDKNGKVDANGDYVQVVLKHGGFTVDAVAFDHKARGLTPHQDVTTCTVWGTATGAVTLRDGTGSYAGIAGKIKITTSFAALGSLYASGPKKGECDTAENAPARAEFDGPITGAGTVSF